MNALQRIKGVGKATAKKLSEVGVCSLHDAVRRIPRRYEARFLSKAETLDTETNRYVEAVVTGDVQLHKVRERLVIVSIPVTINHRKHIVKTFNRPYLRTQLNKGEPIVVYGKRERGDTLICLDVKSAKNFREGIDPVYNISGISDKRYQHIALECLAEAEEKEILPEALRLERALPGVVDFYETLHRPHDATALSAALKRLKYQELLLHQLRVQWQKEMRKNTEGEAKRYDNAILKTFISTLPFALGASQMKAVGEILAELKAPRAMRRLLQGDTGSGKTIVAFIAMLAAVSAGYQCAFMAPTEILAAQHYRSLKAYAEASNVRISLLSASTPKGERKAIALALRRGDIDMLIGTHVLFGKDIDFARLGLVVADEQHRFGVRQREALKRKGHHPDTLYLSATPIPRTLAMTLFGDMDVSTLTERPRGARNVRTRVVTAAAKEEIRSAIRKTLQKDERVFVVVPVIEDSEAVRMPGIRTVVDALRKRFPDAAVGSLHGRLDADEKTRTLKDFHDGDLQILATTSLIEVGMHIPKATLMVVYHADRFGYAQLHQLRGRIAREGQEGLCYLVHPQESAAAKRLKVLETVDDGFLVSEYDLEQRGFGDLFGVLQSGFPQFEHASLKEDYALLSSARDDAAALLKAHHDHGEHERLFALVKKTLSA